MKELQDPEIIEHVRRDRADTKSLVTGQDVASKGLPLDGKASWFACLCAAFSSSIATGSVFIYGVIFPEVLAEFGISKAKAALPGSLAFGFVSLSCPLATALCNCFGCRIVIPASGLATALGLVGSSFAPNIYVLSVSYGILTASGSGIIFMAAFQMVPLYFVKYALTATSVVSTAAGIGTVIMSPLTHILTDYFGWRKAFLILAAINFSSGLLGCAVSRKPLSSPGGISDGEMKWTRRIWTVCKETFLALRNFKLILVLALNIIYCFGHYLPTVHLLEYAEEIGVSTHASSWMYPVIGIISTVVRVLTGKVGDTGLVSFYTMFQCGLVTMALANFLMPLATNVGHLYGYAVTQGISDGLYCASGYCLAIQVHPRLGLTWLFFLTSIPMFAAPPLEGYIADSSDSYHPVFYAAGGFLLLAALVTFLRHCNTRKQSVNLPDHGEKCAKIQHKDKNSNLWQSTTTLVSVVEFR